MEIVFKKCKGFKSIVCYSCQRRDFAHAVRLVNDLGYSVDDDAHYCNMHVGLDVKLR